MPPATSRMPVVVEDVRKRGPKCDTTAQECVKKFPWLSQAGQRTRKQTLQVCRLNAHNGAP